MPTLHRLYSTHRYVVYLEFHARWLSRARTLLSKV
jgi:hypothetical protein